MKLEELSDILQTPVGCWQDVIVYNITDHMEMEPSCSIEYAIKYYGDWKVNRLSSYCDYEKRQDYMVIRLEREV